MATYDLALFQTSATAVTQTIVSADSPSGRTITGAEKLAQRVLLELLTSTGSLPFLPQRGTSFIDSLAPGQVLSEFDAFVSFNQALNQLAGSLSAEETVADPDSERFGGAGIQKVVVAPGLLQLTILIKNKAGDSGLINLPLVIDPSAPGRRFVA